MEATDAELIAASLNDPRAFVGIFERHFESISRYLRRRLSRMVADDLAAEVFATAFSRRFAFDLNRPDALPWLYGIAANLLRARARTEQRELHALARTGIDPVGAGVSDAALGSALEPVLARALLELGPADREVSVVRLGRPELRADRSCARPPGWDGEVAPEPCPPFCARPPSRRRAYAGGIAWMS